ncbi:Oxidoreductase [Vermiconidia calcicola]|uniref:Oxidoreductase n=1 Tax=Vermiconidia calcicola TaxID=1690605 RepID=A0ACC3MYX5_9PEZI|nr:Oxidoreductase [Vermiconidia calcicola]
MFRSATRIASRPRLSRALPNAPTARRFLSTAPPHQKSRSWKSSAARWGLAGGLVYYYNIASVFAEEPAYQAHPLPDIARENETYQTIDSVSEQRRAQARPQAPSPSSESQAANVAAVPDAEATTPGSPQALKEEAGEQGAFNEETGEINWDCPCLGGMAYGPCGDQFRAAFSCFVYSKDEPKGVDCIEHFKTMQNCFREHPDVYGSELEDDDAPADGTESQSVLTSSEPATAGQGDRVNTPLSAGEKADRGPQAESGAKPTVALDQAPAQASATDKDRVAQSNEANDALKPKASHDAGDETETRPMAESDKKPANASERTSAQASATDKDRVAQPDEADDAFIPKASHDARDAEVPKE